MIEGVVYRYVSPDGKSYVGQTIDESRRRVEFTRIANNPNCNSSSYREGTFRDAVRNLGGKNFTYEVLYRQQYETKKDAQIDLWQKEQFFIAYFDSYNNGYNRTIGGHTVKGYKPSQEQVEKQRKWWLNSTRLILTHSKERNILRKQKNSLANKLRKGLGLKLKGMGKPYLKTKADDLANTVRSIGKETRIHFTVKPTAKNRKENLRKPERIESLFFK